MKKLFITVLSVLLCRILPAVEAETASFTVKPGELVSLPETYVKFNSRLDVSVTFKKFQPVSIGCGHNLFQGCWIDVGQKDYTQYKIGFKRVKGPDGKVRRLTDSLKVGDSVWHGVSIRKELNVSILSKYGNGSLTIESQGREEEGALPGWNHAGAPFVKNLGKEPVEVTISFTRLSADEPVWFYGDSYFNVTDGNRWAYYMKKAGYRNWMANHKSGGNSATLLKCFMNDLRYGTPKVAVWMLGMNDPADKDGEPSKVWLEQVRKFLSICDEKGITPVLTTIPTIPKKNHGGKSGWIRKSGIRYVEWAGAVNDESGKWNEGMLSQDGTHPSKTGAEALWKAVEAAVPELEK